MSNNHPTSAEPALTELAIQSLAHARAGDQMRAYELAARCAALLAIAEIDRERAGMCFALCPILAHAGDFVRIEALRTATLRFFNADENASLPEVPRVLNRFGELLRREHRYADAEPLLRKALEAARIRAPDDADTISTISNNLGLVYLATGNVDAAERVLFEALEAALTASGPHSPDVAIVADNLGSLFAARGNRSKSRRFTEQAVEIFQQAGPPDDEDLLTAQIRLAGLDSDDGKLEAAETSLRQVIAAISLASPNGQDLLASASIGLSITLRRANRLDDAASVLFELIQILRDAGGDRSAFAINAKNELARILIALGFHGEALSLLSAVAAVCLAELVRFSMGAAEVRQLDYKQLLSSRLDCLLSLVVTHLAHDPGARELAFLHVANRKGIVNHRLRIRGQATRGATGNVASALQAARSARETALLRGPGLGDESLYRNELIAATERVAELEVRAANELGTMHAVPGIASAAEVCGWLAPNTALVEVIEFRSYASAADPTGDAAPGPKRYLAFVLSAGDPDVKLVDLGDACVIDAEIDRYLSQVAGGHDAERDVGWESRTAGTTISVSTTLWRDVFGPISAVTTCRSLVLSLDGQLAELPFEIIPGDDGTRCVFDDYRISYVTSSRALTRPAGEASTGAAVVIAAPDYDLGGTPPEARVCQPLEGAAAEGADIARRLGVEPIAGPAAVKQFVVGLRRPRVLHLATHGLFFDRWIPDGVHVTQIRSQDGFLIERTNVPGAVRRTAPDRFSWTKYHGAEDGMPRSGLALAGINIWFSGQPTAPEVGTGLLAPAEIIGLDLVGTQLVVLSACDTGRGRTYAGEGVLGLRRAFLVAGAQAVIASAWKVPDEPTRELMAAFYTRHLAGASVTEALREAQREMKEKYRTAYYWGAFTCVAG